ncbi:MAG TPA: 30S ribosomal protein S1 [Saprospiraceae bacterium]|nr:30S ribosomal protein S1 [Saprospiraceae bacterium]HPI07817.1 30S ribosomal protein S1 [Saprospiraceae bacterium]
MLEEEKDLNNEQEEVNTPAEETTEETPAVTNEAEVVAETTEEAPVAVEEPVVVPEPAVEAPAVVEEPVVVPEPAEEAPAVVAAAEVAEPVAAVEPPAEEAVPVVVAEEKPAPAPKKAAAPVVEEEEDDLEMPDLEPVQSGGAHDDFNWAMDKRGAIAYTPADKATLLKQYDATLKSVTENEIIRGRVSAISGGDVVLDINYKSDGLIPLSEFRDTPGLVQGDEVEVYVESQEDSQGQLGLSRRKAKILRAWESIVDSFKNGTIIRGTVISKTKGGLIVDCNGLETFLPGSQIDIKPVIDYDQYVGKVMEFKVVKVNEQIKNAVVSHKALIESDLAEQREQILGSLDKGQVLEGIVKNITDFGAFLDLGGVDGLLYITDISWGRIGHPSELLSLNQRINVVVLDFDENKKRISLGLKQLTPHPWEVLSSEVVEGSIVKGKIVNIEDYGAFVEIQPGVEGLIHISEITWGNQSINAKEYFKMGQEVEARVVTIDRSDRKMSLSIKQLTADPWSEISDRFPIGSRYTGTVKNITNYGIFVELSEGVGGMVHISDLSWTKRYAHPSEFTKVGSPLEVIVLDIDKDKRQISLGHKQTQENPWDGFEELFPVGSYHEATAMKRDDKGATFQLPHGLEAFAPAKHIRKEDGQPVNPGDVVTVKVIEFNKEDRRILVSHTRYLEDLKHKAESSVRAERSKEDGEQRTAIADVQQKVEKETLGDLAALAALKESLEK